MMQQRIVSSSHLDGSSRELGLGRGVNGRLGLKDWAKVLQVSGRFSEVSLEQLERVKLMHDRLSEGSGFSFNYYILMLVASVLAGFGLASNSSSTIIASMVVSPIMG